MLDDRDMDAVFQALSNESRRRMLDLIKEEPGIGVGALASDFDVSRIAVMKHLAVLEQANLVVSEKGRPDAAPLLQRSANTDDP